MKSSCSVSATPSRNIPRLCCRSGGEDPSSATTRPHWRLRNRLLREPRLAENRYWSVCTSRTNTIAATCAYRLRRISSTSAKLCPAQLVRRRHSPLRRVGRGLPGSTPPASARNRRTGRSSGRRWPFRGLSGGTTAAIRPGRFRRRRIEQRQRSRSLVEPRPPGRYCPGRCASRTARNSLVGLQAGHSPAAASRAPMWYRNVRSSRAPDRSQSGFTSSDTAW